MRRSVAPLMLALFATVAGCTLPPRAPIDTVASAHATSRALTVVWKLFAGYRDGTDFAFLNAALRPSLDQFGALDHVSVGTVIDHLRAHFRDKTRLSYEIDLARARAVSVAGGVVVEAPVRMRWDVRAPPSLESQILTFVAEFPVVTHDITMDVQITLDHDARITRYVELGVRDRTWVATGEYECTDDRNDLHPEPWLSLTAGDRVEDLGETVVVGANIKGTDEARKVRINGKIGWALDRVSYAVDNPFGGTSAGGSNCLQPLSGARY